MNQLSAGRRVFWLMGSVVAAAPFAHGAALEPGQIEFLSGVDVAGDQSFSGKTIEKLFTPFSVMADPAQGVVMNGILKQRVVRVDETNTLDFYYRVQVLATETIGIGGVMTHGFEGYFTDAEWRKLSQTAGFTDPEIVSNITTLFLRPASYSQI